MPSDTVVTLAAGALSGIVADGVTHPICTVKARLMTQGAAASAAEGTAEVMYEGLFHGFTTILRTEGVGALYSGIGAVLVGAAPAQALFFTGYEGTRAILGDNPTGNFCAGLGAQLTGSVAWVPMEVIKEKLMIEGQLQTKEKYGSSLSLVTKVIRTEGISGVYRGFVMQQVTYGPLNGLAMMFYNQLKGYMPEGFAGTTGGNLLCSFFGYAAAGFVTTPADVVKTRIQVQASNPELFNFKGPIDCTAQILKNEGIGGLMAGWSGRVGWLAPRCAVAVTAFEATAKAIKGK